MPFRVAVVLPLFVFGVVRAGAADPVASGSEPILLRRCVMEFERTTLLGAAQSGVLQECSTRPGDRVKAGQVLGRLQGQDLQAELELRTIEAESDVEVRLSEAKHAQALGEAKAAEAQSRRNLVAEELAMHKLEVQTASLAIEEARHRRQMALITRKQIAAMLHAREFVAPHDGVVVAVLKGPGESVTLNDTVFRIVGTDHLRVTGYLDVADSWQVRVGQAVGISPEIPGADLPIEHVVFEGRVAFVDSEINPENQTCKVVAIVENRGGLLRAGLEARMEIRAAEAPRVSVAEQEKQDPGVRRASANVKP